MYVKTAHLAINVNKSTFYLLTYLLYNRIYYLARCVKFDMHLNRCRGVGFEPPKPWNYGEFLQLFRPIL